MDSPIVLSNFEREIANKYRSAQKGTLAKNKKKRLKKKKSRKKARY